MSKHAFEKKLEALSSLGVEALPKALADKNNFYVGKAARRAAQLNAAGLIPNLLDAFDRFFQGGAEADPKCWAKVGIMEALYQLSYQQPALYLKAFNCVQMESTWGGKEDTAAPVRATAALALIDTNLDPIQLLRALLKGLHDTDKQVRIETIRALARLGRWEGELLMRQKALTGDAEPEVLGTIYSAILEMDQTGSIGFVKQFLDSDDEAAQLEAAASLAQSRHFEAFEVAKALWPRVLTRDMRRTVAISMGASPLDAARDFLLNLLRSETGEIAIWALTALASSRHREDLREEITSLVSNRSDRQLAQVFREEYS